MPPPIPEDPAMDSKLALEESAVNAATLVGHPTISGTDVLLLDCREPDEHATARIEGARLIPMRDIPERLAELEPWRSKPIVVHCHHGMRSLRVAQFLRDNGFDRAQSMRGGIEAWSLEVDPGVPRY
jgi:rhodanese-related sulfurtransferase